MNNKINRIHERTVRLVYSGYISSCEDLEKESSFSIHCQNIQDLAIKTFKLLLGLSLKTMENPFFRFLSFSKSI